MFKKGFMVATALAIVSVLIGSLIYYNHARAFPTTTFLVDPPSIVDPGLTPGNTFTVDINVSDVVDLYAWQIHIEWNSSILNLTTITFGDFLADQPGGTLTFQNVYQDLGSALLGETSRGAIPGVDGSGRLTTVEFLVIATGETVLDISGGDMQLTYYVQSENIGTPVYPATENGYFSNIPTEKLSTAVYFNLNPNPVDVGETLTLKGILVDQFSQFLPNETVELYARSLGGSWQHITSMITNAYGIFTWQATIPGEAAPGTYVFAVYYPGSENYESTYNLAILSIPGE